MKIISTCCWGNKLQYIQGVIEQYQLAKFFFPEFEFRVYTDNKSQFEHLEANVIHVEKSNVHGSFWRFAPLFESENNITIVRDSDSRFTIREVMAINEWLQSDKKFHNIKDHPRHYDFPIMAGMFGYKGKLHPSLLHLMYQIGLNHQYGVDQYWLRFVYEMIKQEELLHHMNVGWFSETRKRLKNKYSFVGNGYDENNVPIYAPDETKENKEEYKFDKGVLEENEK